MSDLIDKLRKLNPTPGEWTYSEHLQPRNVGGRNLWAIRHIYIKGDTYQKRLPVAEADANEQWAWVDIEEDNLALILAAPSMRLELLRMADELTALRDENAALKTRAERLALDISRTIDSIQAGGLLRNQPETYRNGCVDAFNTISEILKRDNEAQP